MYCWPEWRKVNILVDTMKYPPWAACEVHVSDYHFIVNSAFSMAASKGPSRSLFGGRTTRAEALSTLSWPLTSCHSPCYWQLPCVNMYRGWTTCTHLGLTDWSHLSTDTDRPRSRNSINIVKQSYAHKGHFINTTIITLSLYNAKRKPI